jgi:hypothetical protein
VRPRGGHVISSPEPDRRCQRCPRRSRRPGCGPCRTPVSARPAARRSAATTT